MNRQRPVTAALLTALLSTCCFSSACFAAPRRPVTPAAPPPPRPAVDWAYGDTGEPPGLQWLGERPDEAGQGIKALWSRVNGLRIQVRRKPGGGRALVSLRFDITDPRTSLQRPPGVGEMIERGLIPGGLGRYSHAQAAALFDGRGVRLAGVRVSDDAITYAAACRGASLGDALDLLRAYFGDPGWRREAEPGVKSAWLQDLRLNERDVDAQVAGRVKAALAGPFPWRRDATAAEVRRLTFRDADGWLGQVLSRATLTVTIVGDVPPDAAETAAQWFWHYRVPVHFMMASTDDVRQSLPPAPALKPGIERLTVEGATARSVVHVVWPTDDAFDISRARRLDVLARCLSRRLSTAVRARFGPSASARAWSTVGESFRGDGQLHALVTLRSGQGADRALAVIRAESASLAAHDVVPSVFVSAKAAAVRNVAREISSDEWWFSTVLPYAAWQPFRISWASNIGHDYRAMTAAEVSALAKQYLVNGKALAVIGISRPRA